MSMKAIETTDLTVYYGQHRGILNVNLTVEQGEVFGFLGPNGAGKTTTQRVLLDVIRPTSGQAKIFGLDCQTQGAEVRKRISYLPTELSFYPTMTGEAFLRLLASLNQNKWNQAYCNELYERLGFDPSRKLRTYSRGNKQKVGLIAAFMGKPDLLILDEPTGGLDPLVQQTVLQLVREVKANGRSVFFSSHILNEVEAVCDRVGIIRAGELIQTERVETLTHQQFKRLRLTLRTSPEAGIFQKIEGVTEKMWEGATVLLEIQSNLEQVMATAVPFGIIDIETVPLSLEEIFLAYYGTRSA